MTLLQKTNAVLLGLVFCFGVNNEAFALEEEFCRCVVKVENAEHCPDITNAENIEFDFSENRNLSWIIQKYAAEPTACQVSSFDPGFNSSFRVDRGLRQIPTDLMCFSPIGMSASSVLTKIGSDTTTNVDGWSLLGSWNLDTMMNKKINSKEKCNNIAISQYFGKEEIICYGSTEEWFSVEMLSVDPEWNLQVRCGSATVELGSGSTEGFPVDYGPGYEPIAWSFPTDKINALNKVGISGSGTTQVQLLIGRLIKYAVGFLGALALCLVIYSGLKFMLSQGEEDKQGEALKMMLWAGIGIVALLGSYSMVTFVLSILR